MQFSLLADLSPSVSTPAIHPAIRRAINAGIGFVMVIALCLCITCEAHAQRRGGTVSVRGSFRSNGTYVAPHHRTAPDSTRRNNWSTQGNVNPYTGREGTQPAYTVRVPRSSFSVPRTYSSRPRGYGKINP